MMKIRLLSIIVHFFLFSIPCLIIAQERTGYVTDEDGVSLDLATVVLFAGEQQAAVAVTDTTGRFLLSVADGEYVIKIRNITYKPLEQSLEVKPGTEELGVFKLEESVLGLDEVVVEASPLTREADRFVMRIANIPSMLNKDITEVLRLAPGVWVDDAGISINGMKGAKVFINERELKLPEKELADYLRNFQSSDIARIEIIPQAGPEYSADSRGGIIKIFLRKQQENGASGNISFRTLQGERIGDYRPSGTLNARVGRWMLNAFASGGFRSKGDSELSIERAYDQEAGHYFRSESYMSQKPRSGIGRIGVIFEPDSRNSLGGELEITSGKMKMPSMAETVMKEDGIIINGMSDYRQHESDRNISATFNYVYHLDTLGSVLKLITDYTDKKVTGNNHYHSLFEVWEDRDVGTLNVATGKQEYPPGVYNNLPFTVTDSLYRSSTFSRYKIFTADLSLSKQLRQGMTFSAGARYTRNDMSDTVRYESCYLSEWSPVNEYNFLLDYMEDIGAVYGTFMVNKGGLSLSAGLRGEYTHVTGKRDELRRSYFDLFPNANISYSFNAMRTFMLIGQYSRSIQRPNFWYLNPNRVQYSDYSYMVGNPNLKPTYINRFSLTAVYRYRYVLSIGGTLHHNLIREVCKIDPSNPDVTYITPENHHTENHYYVALSFPLRLAKWCNINANLVGVKQDIRGMEGEGRKSHYLYFNNVTTSFSLPAGLYLEVVYGGTSRLYSANAGIEPTHLFHATIKKQLFRERVTVSLGIQNIFDKKTSYFSNTERFTIHSDERGAFSSRHIKCTLQYNFKTGKTFKKRTVEGISNGEKSRIEKSSEKK